MVNIYAGAHAFLHHVLYFVLFTLEYLFSFLHANHFVGDTLIKPSSVFLVTQEGFTLPTQWRYQHGQAHAQCNFDSLLAVSVPELS